MVLDFMSFFAAFFLCFLPKLEAATSQFGIFDWDANLVFMPTHFRVELDGHPIKKNHSELENLKQHLSAKGELHRLQLPNDFYIEFSDPPRADKQYFEDQLKVALDHQQYGPDYNEFKAYLLRGDVCAIVTAREHKASTLRSGVFMIIQQLSASDKVSMQYALTQRLKCLPVNCIELYLDEWSFYAVNSPELHRPSGLEHRNQGGTASSKVRAVRHFVEDSLSKVEDITSHIKFRFSDDEPLNVQSMHSFFEQLQKEKGSQFPNIDFLAVNTSPPPSVLKLEYSEIQAGKDLRHQIHKALGPGGLGIILQCGIPGLNEALDLLLPQARQLALLPKEILARYERQETSFCSGWSRGREQFKGQPDVSKGSFYANPLYDDPADGNESVRTQFPYAASRNIWPSQELVDFDSNFKRLGKLAYEAAKPLVRQLDAIVASQIDGYSDVLFHKIFTESRLTLGRLLHYYAGKESSWCGWHNDNSGITVLTPELWMDENTGKQLPKPKTAAGLQVRTSYGETINVTIPRGCMGFQIGEAAQILTAGVLKAVPHAVAGHISKNGALNISRETYALFIEPQWDSVIGPPAGHTLEQVVMDEESQLIPPLSKRLPQVPVSFGEYLGYSTSEYYKHNNPKENPSSPARDEL